MVRTQISLTEKQKRRLDGLAAGTGRSLSELVRRAIDHCYEDSRDLDADIEGIRQALGAWQDRGIEEAVDGAQYVERLRSARRPNAS